MAQRLTEYLEIADGRTRCCRCSADICDHAENYKLWVLQDRAPITEVPGAGDPAPYGMASELELRRYYCPGCAVQLDTEVSLPGAAPLWDFQVEAAADVG